MKKIWNEWERKAGQIEFCSAKIKYFFFTEWYASNITCDNVGNVYVFLIFPK